MPKNIAISDLLQHLDQICDKIKKGACIIYPTDTIYGIGTIVSKEGIARINQTKQRLPGKHYSIIVPDLAWILEHMDIEQTSEEELEVNIDTYKIQFPGRGFTFLMPLKKEFHNTSLSLLSPTQILGIRLLNHPIQHFVQALGEPLITTSCNISGTSPIIETSDIPKNLSDNVDLIIDGGTLDGKASIVIDWVSGEIVRR